MNITIDGTDIGVKRKNIRNIHVYVKPDCTVVVTAPMWMSDDEIYGFVSSKSEWIRKHLDRFASAEVRPPQDYEDGSTIRVFGDDFPLSVQTDTGYSMLFSDGRMILTVRQSCTQEQKEKFVKNWYRDLLGREIEKTLPRLEISTGLRCSGWQIRDMKTRWGTCNTRTCKIWLNLRLAEKSPDCLEYVIIHELIHTRIKNHGPEFKNAMDMLLPEWRSVKKKLNSVN
jgi:predicted metal-dependent hydrolase